MSRSEDQKKTCLTPTTVKSNWHRALPLQLCISFLCTMMSSPGKSKRSQMLFTTSLPQTKVNDQMLFTSFYQLFRFFFTSSTNQAMRFNLSLHTWFWAVEFWLVVVHFQNKCACKPLMVLLYCDHFKVHLLLGSIYNRQWDFIQSTVLSEWKWNFPPGLILFIMIDAGVDFVGGS